MRGPSGVGKSDLALRALEAGWRLVADDRVIAWPSGGRLYARAPRVLAGLLEARTLGVRPIASLGFAEVALVVDLHADAAALERVPEPGATELCGLRLPCVALAAREASASAKLALALQAATLGAGPEPAYLAPRTDEVEEPDARAGASHEE
jgi:serine kinase of HPr protein (carbohydrate metabolism regulator)